MIVVAFLPLVVFPDVKLLRNHSADKSQAN
jgi:hypothetical protein